MDNNAVSFEENYIFRNNRSITSNNDIALTEFVAIDAYVVGAKLGDIDPEKNTTSGRIHAVTYGQLVDTASGKLFRLRDRLKEHYDSLGQESIVEQALRDSKQLKMNI